MNKHRPGWPAEGARGRNEEEIIAWLSEETQRTPKVCGTYKRLYDRFCPGAPSRLLFRGSALTEDKYTLNSLNFALNVNTAGRSDTGTPSPGNRPILVPCSTGRTATVKLKSVKANGRYTINVSAVSSLSVINFCSRRGEHRCLGTSWIVVIVRQIDHPICSLISSWINDRVVAGSRDFVHCTRCFPPFFLP